ncbi:MAG: J domain-containing protein [Desulfuromonadaceae bacterium]|nr:J domain-containing protein [Desulfuromonadaceae bacterium]
MPLFAENELLDACRVLFGAEVQLSRDFLFYMQPSGVKTAYRQKAKETHPDLFVNAPEDESFRQGELFRSVCEAYQLLDRFTADPRKRVWLAADRKARFDGPEPFRSDPSNDATDAWNRNASMQSLPRRYLETGLYLYHRGLISYAEMIEALVWQRRQRPVIGTLAERWGWLTSEHLQQINRYHGRHGRFGSRAVALGYLTPFQLQVLLRYQQRCQQPFAQYFVEQGLMTGAEVEAYIREQQRHNAHYPKRRR